MNWPNGFFRAFTLSGADAGLGFHCEKCHLVYPHGAPEEVFHCGAVQRLEKKLFQQLPEVRLGYAPAEPISGMAIIE